VRSSALSLFTRAQSTSLTPMRCLSFLLNGKNARTSQSYLRLFYLICPADNGPSTGWAGWGTVHLRLREKIFRVVFSTHRLTLAPTGAERPSCCCMPPVERRATLRPARARSPRRLPVGRLSCRPVPCSAASMPPGWPPPVPPYALLGRLSAFPAPAAPCRPSASTSGLPCRCARLLATSPPCPPGPPPSGGPASLLGSARRCLLPPSRSAWRGGASLAPCSTARLLMLPLASVLGCSTAPCRPAALAATAVLPQSISLSTSQAGVPRCGAPATLPSGPVAPPCSTGSTAPLATVLCATVPGIVFAY
jgi:hypothetical protein